MSDESDNESNQVNRNMFGVRLVCATALVVCAAASSAAQDGGPFGNLFKGTGKPRNQSLDLSGGLFGGYDDTPLAQAPNGPGFSPFDPSLQAPGVTSGFSSAATYHYGHTGRGKSATSFGVAALASVQEFSGGTSKPLWSPNYGASTSFGTNLTPKISLGANAGLSYAPYYQYAPFLTGSGTSGGGIAVGEIPGADTGPADPGVTPAPPVTLPNQPVPTISPVGSDIGFAAQSEFVTHLTSGISISDRFTKRSSISLGAGTERARSSTGTVESLSGTVSLSHNLTRKIGVHFGYRLQESRFVSPTVPETRNQSHGMDFGIDYGDGGSFSFARYYTLSFTTGLGAVQQGDQTQFRLDGSITLVRRIARSWAASIGAARGTAYVLGFGEPLFTDSANVGVGGQIAPRLNFSAGGAYLVGQRAFSGSGETLVSKSASTRLTLGISRHLGLYGQLSYYQYDVPNGFFTTVDFPQQQHRRSASVGLSFSVPLLKQRTARQP